MGLGIYEGNNGVCHNKGLRLLEYHGVGMVTPVYQTIEKERFTNPVKFYEDIFDGEIFYDHTNKTHYFSSPIAYSVVLKKEDISKLKEFKAEDTSTEFVSMIEKITTYMETSPNDTFSFFCEERCPN